MASRPKTDLLLSAVVALALYFLLFFGLSRLLPDSRHWQGTPQLYFLLVACAILRAHKVDAAALGLRWRRLGGDLLYGLLVALIPLAVVVRYAVTFEVEWGAARWSSWLAVPANVYRLFLLTLLAPVGEELFFRGVLARALRAHFAPWWVVIVSAVIFSSAHFAWSPGPLLLGIGTTVLFLKRDSVVPGMVLHALCNLLGPLLALSAPAIYQELRLFFA